MRRKDGSEIGTVVQENDVPAGLLDGPWGDVAYTVAVAAQDGIMALIARGAPQFGRQNLNPAAPGRFRAAAARLPGSARIVTLLLSVKPRGSARRRWCWPLP